MQQVAIVGTPDFLGCVAGHFVAVELKATPKDKLRPMQQYNLDRIKAAGGIGLVVHGENCDDALAFLQKLGETGHA